MMNGKVIGVYNKDNILSATASKYNFEGALRPCSQYNNPYSFIQSYNFNGKYAIGAESSEINVIIDLQKVYHIHYFSVFSLSNQMESFTIKKYCGEEKNPLPTDPKWETFTVECKSQGIDSDKSIMTNPKIVEIPQIKA